MTTYEQIKNKAKYKFNVKKSGERLLWRFKERKNFTPNDNDMNALECILEWINRQTSENVKNNQLFAKLYIQYLIYTIQHHQTTIIDPMPQHSLSRLLNRPLELFYHDFYTDIHNNQLNKLSEYHDYNKLIDKEIQDIKDGKVKFIYDKDPRYFDESEERKKIEIEKKQKEKISDQQQKEIIKVWFEYKEEFDLDFVTKKLNLMISEALNRFS